MLIFCVAMVILYLFSVLLWLHCVYFLCCYGYIELIFCATMITFRNVEFLFGRLQFLWLEGVAAVRVELHDVRSENTT